MLILAKTKTRFSSFKKAGLKKTADEPTDRRPNQKIKRWQGQQNKGTDETQSMNYPLSPRDDVVRPRVKLHWQEPNKGPDKDSGHNVMLLAPDK